MLHHSQSEVSCMTGFASSEAVSVFLLFIRFQMAVVTMASPNLKSSYSCSKLSACLPRDDAEA